MKVLTIDKMIQLLELAKNEIGGDKPIILTGEKGKMMFINDANYNNLKEQLYYYHLSAHSDKDSFGISTWTNGIWIDAPELNLKQLEGKEPIPSTIELLREAILNT